LAWLQVQKGRFVRDAADERRQTVLAVEFEFGSPDV